MAIWNRTGLSRPRARKVLHFRCTSPRILFLNSSTSTTKPSALPGSEHRARMPLCSLTIASNSSIVRMSAGALDLAAARLEEIRLEEEKLRSELQEQVEEFGFTPPRAEKSKRLTGIFYDFTVTRGLTTEIKDAEVARIRAVCPNGLFGRLFKTVTKFKLADGAFLLLASPLPEDAPRNLRLMFSKAVETKETARRLRIEKMADECP